MFFARAYIYTTTRCNFNCPHCFVGEERKKLKPVEIDLSLVEQFIHDFGAHEKYGGFKTINITGVGNPLLYGNLVDLIRLLRQFARDELSINCRGKISDDLLNAFAYYGVVVYYSMDYFGTRADEQMNHEGLWKEQIETLNKMLRMGIPVRIRTTIMKDNIFDCLQFIGLVERYRMRGANIEWHGMPYLPYGGEDLLPTADQMKLLTSITLTKSGMRIMHPFWTCIHAPFRDRAKRWWHKVPRICEAGRVGGRIALTQDGEILPCPFDVTVLAKYRKIKGSWKIDMARFEENLRKYLNQNIPEFCSDCSLKDFCKGGCRIHQKLSDRCICPKDLWGGVE